MRDEPISNTPRPTDATELERLRREYTDATGKPFEHFFCPILYRDEATELCRGHVINEAFPDTDRRRVLQRADVDHFFGSRFESEFVLLADRGRHSPIDVLLDRDLSKKARPRLRISGKAVDHYLPSGDVPGSHSHLSVEREGVPPVRLAIKMEPNDTLASIEAQNWRIEIERDLRLPSLVSLLKAAHLSMFALMGYSYALTAGGYFVGRDVLGRYASDCLAKRLGKTDAVRRAASHFPEFANMVRPMLSAPPGFDGTISDQRLLICEGSPKPWAFIVFVRTGREMHAVALPIMEDAEGGARFVRFLQRDSARIEIRSAQFAGDRWLVSPKTSWIDWPRSGFSE